MIITSGIATRKNNPKTRLKPWHLEFRNLVRPSKGAYLINLSCTLSYQEEGLQVVQARTIDLLQFSSYLLRKWWLALDLLPTSRCRLISILAIPRHHFCCNTSSVMRYHVIIPVRPVAWWAAWPRRRLGTLGGSTPLSASCTWCPHRSPLVFHPELSTARISPLDHLRKQHSSFVVWGKRRHNMADIYAFCRFNGQTGVR